MRNTIIKLIASIVAALAIVGLSVSTSCELFNNSNSSVEIFIISDEGRVSLGQVQHKERIFINNWLWVKLEIEDKGKTLSYDTTEPPSSCIFSSGLLFWYKRTFKAEIAPDGNINLLGNCSSEAEPYEKPLSFPISPKVKVESHRAGV